MTKENKLTSDTKRGTITAMAKRTFIQVEASEEYKAEFQRLIGPYMPMANEIKRLLEEAYPSLKQIAEKERGGSKTLLQRLADPLNKENDNGRV